MPAARRHPTSPRPEHWWATGCATRNSTIRLAALAVLSDDIAANVKSYKSLSHVPAAATPNLRTDMYLTGDAIRLLPKQGAKFSAVETATLKSYTDNLNKGTRFIPLWVKVCVAIGGLGTMKVAGSGIR